MLAYFIIIFTEGGLYIIILEFNIYSGESWGPEDLKFRPLGISQNLFLGVYYRD